MASIRNLTLNIKSGQTEELPIRGDGLRLVSANVPIYFKSIEGDMDFYLEQGEQALFDEKIFKRMQVFHASGVDQTITITVSEGSRFNGAKISGSVSIMGDVTPVRATGANTQKTVTNASTEMVAANASRSYLLIQNKDTAGNIYINFGAEATVGNGLKIDAGGSYELNGNMLTAAIFTIGDIGSNANIVVIEG
ncbi:MAG: hypothetical protein PHO76_02575 [Methylotenera sp.]|nr:hypothetical protein [Methylotenera sp.]MDD4927228.1 hypothetical protein [Methylotenera sp.]